jgi:lactoylglutathione lyase
MKLDGFGLFVKDMKTMVAFYRDVLGFEIAWQEGEPNVYLIKDGTLFMLYGREDFEKMTQRRYQYLDGLNGHYEIALSVESFSEVDRVYAEVVAKGARSVLAPETEPWGQRTCYIADPEGNLIEIGSFNNDSL